jgi:putative ABC transport system permease protein
MVLAVAVGLVSVGALLTAYAMINREAAASYTATNPASATLEIDGEVDDELLAQVRRAPWIVDAAARQTVVARVRVGEEWRRIVLYVIDEDDPMRVAKVDVERGAWPPPADGILIERSAVDVLGTAIGGTLTVDAPGGPPTPITVTGVVHDAAQAQAWQERAGYGYLTPAGLARLGATTRMDQLKIVIADTAGGVTQRPRHGASVTAPAGSRQATIDARATELAALLTAHGYPVKHIDVPPPGQHPHQRQVNTLIVLFLGAAVAGLLVAAVVVATTLGGILSQQVRQIGVLKTLGATTGQLLGIYLLLTTAIALVGVALATGPAVAAGMAITDATARRLNIDLIDRSVPAWVLATTAAVGLAVPLLVALVPLTRAARVTVRTALDSYGAPNMSGRRRLGRWLPRLTRPSTFVLALRNAARRRGRLVLTLGLLTASGALFTAGVNTALAYSTWVENGVARSAHQAEIRLDQPVPIDRLKAALATVDSVTGIEPILTLPAAEATAGQFEISRTYPDAGHGSFSIMAVAADSPMYRPDVVSGRWLRPTDHNAIVISQNAAQRFGDAGPGTEIKLDVAGHDTTWQVIGIINDPRGTGAFTSAGALDAIVGFPATANALWLATGTTNTTGTGSGAGAAATLAAAERALANAGIGVAVSTTVAGMQDTLDNHVLILITAAIVLGLVLGTVGVFGLASSMSIAITERTRELGVMQAIGATPRMVRHIVLTEGLLIGLAGALAAVLIGIPAAAGLGRVLEQLSFGPLPLTVSAPGTIGWILLATAAAALATWGAARRAGRMSIRETLSYE